MPKPAAQVRLLCFPFGGGGASFYHRWNLHLPAWLELTAVQLPGRESRMREAPLSNILAGAQIVAEELAQWQSERMGQELHFFGHSMGSLLAFEVARALRNQGSALPSQLFISARRAPHLANSDEPLHELPDARFALAVIRRYNGIPKVILENAELLRIFLPILRGDMRLIETYTCAPEAPLPLPFHMLGGAADLRVPEADLYAWQEQSALPVTVQMFAGDHFYLQPLQQEVIGAVVQRIEAHRQSAGVPESGLQEHG